ncbi:hypothetical protein [Streptomyces sp. NPDC021212]|uniref:hypothetical protein n=1 Tax=Streptomyces sp. NPDC021212 TaxID=3365118 RepID=UPI00379BD0CA
MPRRLSGILIGSVFGTVFVLANAHAPLAPAAGTALRVLALAALTGLVAIMVLVGRRGAHFLVLMAVWKQRSIAVPGAALTVLGAAGLAMAATPAVDWVPFVSGVLSGAVLLGGGTYAVTREYRAAAGAPAPHDEGADRPG